MNDKEIFKKVGAILSEIGDQYRYLSDNPGSLNEFELELLRANAKFLADHIEILHRYFHTNGQSSRSQEEGSHAPTSGEEAPAPVTDAEPVAAQHEAHAATEPQPEQHQSPREEEPLARDTSADDGSPADEPGSEAGEQPADDDAAPEQPGPEEEEAGPEEQADPEEEPAKEEEPEAQETAALTPVEDEQPTGELPGKEAPLATGSSAEQQPAKEHPEEEASSPAAAEPGEAPFVHRVVISERTVAIDEPVKTLNERMAESLANAATLGASVGRQQVKDLKSSISLNDKLLFVKDLFNGYSLAYSEAVDIANRSASLEAARNFLESNYAAKNNWADKAATRDRFYEILGSRFE